MWTLALVAALWLAAPVPRVASGRIVSEDGAPVPNAQICESAPGGLEKCVNSDEQGGYTVPNATHPTLLVRAKGFVTATVDAAPLAQPVTLKRAASLIVTVLDETDGKPVASGRVMLAWPSGKVLGDYVPFNKAGVRISTVEPGVIFVRAEAPGYEPGGPVPIELESGVESSVTVTMKKAGAKPR